METTTAPPALRPRPVAGSLAELLAGATRREPFASSDGKSAVPFERVLIGGGWHVVKYLHVDDDWIARGTGDVRCLPLRVWRAGLLDALPDCLDPAVVGAAEGLGRNGWGAALLMRDVGEWLVPPGDAGIPAAQHARFLDHMVALHARFWGFTDTIGLAPTSVRWMVFGPEMLALETARPDPPAVPVIAVEGWRRFAHRAPADVADAVDALRVDPGPLVEALAATPTTLLHGDWKLGNLGSHPDGRTILLDWQAPGEGPATADLSWYLALNRSRLPESKEDAVARYAASLAARGVATEPWFGRQLALTLLGAVVQLGWEKAYDDDSELGWWCDRAREGLSRL